MYYLMFLIPLGVNKLKISERIKGISIAIALALLAIFRFGIGADYFSYSYIYNLVPNNSLASAINSLGDKELFIKALIFPFRFANQPYEVFVAFIAIFIMVLTYLWIAKNSHFISFSFLVYYSFFYLVWNLSGLRQGLAIAIGCYLLFNEKYKWNSMQKVIIIGLLYFVHVSALFYLVFVALDFFKFDRKKLVIFVIIALVISMIPTYNIGLWLSQFPFFNRIISYFNPNSIPFGFWDYKSIPRIFLIVLVLTHYEALIKKSLVPQRFLNAFVVGISFFFILRFNETVGTRMSIYGFFLSILILPAILSLYNYRSWITFLAKTSFVMMCALFLLKDLSAVSEQSGITKIGILVPYYTIYQKGNVKFTNPYFYANNYKNIFNSIQCNAEIDEFHAKNVSTISTIMDPLQYFAVLFPNSKYGLIDVEGNIVLQGRFSDIEYYGGIIRTNSIDYYDFLGNPLDTGNSIIEFNTAKDMTTKLISEDLSWLKISRYTLDLTLINKYETEGEFRLYNIIQQKSQFGIYAVEYYTYNYRNVYRLYNNGELLSEQFSILPPKILANRVVQIESSCGIEYFNESGKLIWISRK